MRPKTSVLLIIAIIACSQSEHPSPHSAQYHFLGSDLFLAVELHRSHPFLAEYDRSLVFGGGRSGPAKIDLFPDSGGYALVNLYRAEGGDYVVRTQGNHYYVVSLQGGSLTPHEDHAFSRNMRAAGEEFIGAFDFDAQRVWRFIGAAERAERKIGQIYLRE